MPHASVLTRYGPPEVLEWAETELPEPEPGQVRIRVRAAGVGPTDAKIRRGDLQTVFPLPPRAVLGFEVAGTVDAVGSAVQGVTVGDDVAALLPRLGGYAEFALASSWTRKPPEVAWSDAAALPASAEAAVGVLAQLGVERGETLLILGAGGSVGVIGTQLARSGGLTVIGAAGAADQDLVRELGAVPVLYGPGLAARVREHVPAIDAVFDAAGAGGLDEAIELAGGPSRVITLADERAAELGVALSAPTPDRAPGAVDETMALLGSGALRLRAQTLIPMQRAAEAHALLDTGRARRKMVLVAPTPG